MRSPLLLLAGVLVLGVLVLLQCVDARVSRSPARPAPATERMREDRAEADVPRAARVARIAVDPPAPAQPGARGAPAALPDVGPVVRRLHGRLLHADGAPARGKALSYVVHDARMRPISWPIFESLESRKPRDQPLEPDGGFAIPLAPEACGVRLVASASGHARLDRWVALEARAGDHADHDVGTLVLARGARIEGELWLGDATPDAWRVEVTSIDPTLPAFLAADTSATRVDTDGRFEPAHVAPGLAHLRVSHPLLGTVMERRLVLADGESARVELAHAGPDPARMLVVDARGPRPPAMDEIWLEDGHGRRLPARSIDAERVLFTDVTRGPEHTLVLALADAPRVEQRGVRAGSRVRITVPDAPRSDGIDMERLRKTREVARRHRIQRDGERDR